MTSIELRRHKANLQRERRRRLERAGFIRLDVTIAKKVLEKLYPLNEQLRYYPGSIVAELLEQIADGRLPSKGVGK